MSAPGAPGDAAPWRVAVTGADGFVAWHLRAALRARYGVDAVAVRREHFAQPALMDRALAGVDAVIHLAGVNRAADEQVVAEVNPWLAEQLVASLRRIGRAVPVVYGNSIHAEAGSTFGVAKRRAGEILSAWGRSAGAPVLDVLLPNLFGEHGAPFTNSVVATFCHQLAAGQTPEIHEDRELPLLHVQRAATVLLDAAASPATSTLRLPVTPLTVRALLEQLTALRDRYRTADLPDLSDPFTRDLFNTYRSFTFPQHWPVYPAVRGDQRGELFEAVRAAGGQAQVFVSSTRPGFTRGNHFHLHKVERFVVLRGSAVISLRRLFTEEVVHVPVSGERPAVLDMPTLWTHAITNTGEDELVTLFHADEVFDPERPDTYPEQV